jgi:hypothetical protein
MPWAKMLAYVTGSVDREFLLRDEFLAALLGSARSGDISLMRN